MKPLCLTVLVAAFASADVLRPGTNSLSRRGRQQDAAVQGGVDFSACTPDPESGLCCVTKIETVQSIEKDPILECTHTNVEKCHYTYVTQFEPTQEEVCDENFEKSCQITFKQQAMNETVKKCYKPLEKVCNGQGEEECRTVYESSCTTKYVEKQPGKFVGDTKCEKLPIEICGAGCVTEEGPEECHDKVITSLIDVPEEVCDLNPQKTCRFQTKLVPKLKPAHECTVIPKETCNLKFSSPRQVDKPLETKWCLDDTAPTPGETCGDAAADPLGPGQGSNINTNTIPNPGGFSGSQGQGQGCGGPGQPGCGNGGGQGFVGGQGCGGPGQPGCGNGGGYSGNGGGLPVNGGQQPQYSG